MSQPNPYYPDFAPKRDPRGSAPGSNQPVNEINHTQEVRTLINDLQTAAREARARTTAVEQERDDLAARLAEAKTQLGEFRQQFVEISSVLRERDEAVARAENIQRHANEMQRHLEVLTRERNDSVKGREENARLAREAAQQLDETQRQLVSIRGARDSAQAVNLELNQRLQELRDEVNTLRDDRDFTKNSADKLAEEAIALRQKLEQQIEEAASLRQKLDDQAREIAEVRQKLEQQTQSLAESERSELTKQIDELAREREAFREADRVRSEQFQDKTKEVEEIARQLNEAKASHDQLVAQHAEISARHGELNARFNELQAEAERLRVEGSGNTVLESQLVAAQQQLAEAEQRAQAAVLEAEQARVQRDAVAEKADQAETQRLCAIDLAAQLENAKRDLIALAANLAEARLQNKANQSKLVRAAQTQPTSSGASGALSSSSAPPLAVPPQNTGMSPLMAPEITPQEPLNEKEARSILTAIRECHQSYVRDASDLSLLNELHCHVHFLSERARTSNFGALNRFAASLSLFAQELYRFPEQANSSALRTLEQAIELLAVLLKQPDYRLIKDPSKARVYAVDDDIENCDAIRMGLETVMLRTKSTQQPAVALSEISSEQFDLIFLDVSLPHMDGFELCQHIRQLPNYARTPIVFLTGLTTIENRVQSSLSGGNDFVGKPFNLHELSVKALTLVLKASLDMD